MFTRIIPLAIVLIFSGCAFAPQAVLLKPDVNIRSGNIGSNKPIILNVIDERTKTTLGTRAPNLGADLTIEGDIVETVSDSLSKGLLAQGFQITKSSDEGTTKPKELRVELRSLEYRVIRGFFSGTLKTESAMKGICIVDLLRPYEKLYRGAHEESIQIVQTEASNNKYINIALSHTINNLLSDSSLLKCLAK